MSSNLHTQQQELLSWFKDNKRNLPWRKAYHPYEVWISEIMLQQTQMDRVVLFFKRWMQHFPTLEILGRSSEKQVLKCWEGLGYYRRARNIKKAALTIQRDYQGRIPSEIKILLKLPGIGPYTAAAIASIAFQQNEPLVDANISRLFARFFNIDMVLNRPEAKKLLWKKAAEFLPKGQARNFNQALMELGALVCTPKNPSCTSCPWSSSCKAYLYELIPERPLPAPSKKTINIEMATGLLEHGNKLFIQQRLADDVWGSLWEFPGGRLQEGETAEDAVLREFVEETGFTVKITKKITTTIHHYTRYKVNLHCFSCSFADKNKDKNSAPELTAAQQYCWVSFHELDNYAFPAGHRKLIDYLSSRTSQTRNKTGMPIKAVSKKKFS